MILAAGHGHAVCVELRANRLEPVACPQHLFEHHEVDFGGRGARVDRLQIGAQAGPEVPARLCKPLRSGRLSIRYHLLPFAV